MTLFHYLAYGSNLHPLRLQERAPSARVIGVIEVTGRQLNFHKKGQDSSGKCNFHETGSQQDVVFAVLYELTGKDKNALDIIEGKGKGYNEASVGIECDDTFYTPFTYIADTEYIDTSLTPFDWYKQLVIEGAKFHGMPEKYISWLESVTSISDPDVSRNAENLSRLDAIKAYNNTL